jgi:hypothetical protein
MYEKDEILITTENIGSKKKGNFIPKGTEVVFLKVADGGDLSMSMVAFEYDGKTRVTLESNTRLKDKKKMRKALRASINQVMEDNPRARRYHYNFVKKVYYRIYYFFVDKFGGKK